MSSENTTIWDLLSRTDPAHTKSFSRSGGFKGTAIKPIWSFRRMTEEFGPCGKGWGVDQPEFQVVTAGDEILVFCTVGVWWTNEEVKEGDEYARNYRVYGVGGDKVVNKFSSGLKSDDEAFKKAFTDAVTNALKLIGVGADVHMGMFEDNKYVADMRREFAEEPEPRDAPVKSSAQLKRENAFPEFDREVDECTNLIQLDRLTKEWREKASKDGWNSSFKMAAKERLDRRREQLSQAPDDDQFPGDLPSDLNKNAYASAFRAG